MKSDEPNFDRVARIYRWAEYFTLGPLLQRTRMHFLAEIQGCESAFILGDGDGRFTAALLASNPGLHAVAVDSSARMLDLLRTRCSQAKDRLETRHISALQTEPPADTDLIVSHFFLDCFCQADIETLVQRLADHCRPGTLWLVSDFQIPRQQWLKPIATAYIRSLYLAFRWLTGLRVAKLPDVPRALEHCGFRRVHHHSKLGGTLYTEIWRLEQER